VAKDAGADFVYSHKTNRGPGVVFRTAVEHALENGADILAYIDADGQFNPQDIPTIINPILNGEADMISADRFGEHKAKNMPAAKYYLNRLAAWMIGLFMNYPIKDLTCGFRGYSRETLLRLNLPGAFTYTQEVIIDALGKDLKIKWIPVEVTYFEGRKSRVVRSIYKYVNNSAKIILKAVRDVRPMKFFGVPGLFLIVISVLVFGYFATLYFQLLVFAFIADMIKSNRKLTEDQMYLIKKEKYKK